jgi:RHS repeat-associated protein
MNGNQILYGKRYFTFDYRNRVTGTGLSGATSTYTYDDSDQRVKVTEGGITTYYPSKLYSKEGATSTKNVYLGDQLIATIEGGQAATTTSTIHHDHLGGTNVVTNAAATSIETTDYYPYGSLRIDTKTTTFDEKRKYIGQIYDSTGLNYLNARFQDPLHGRFVSQDPVFIEVGFDLTDPQSMQAYSYARNNPILMVDIDGKQFEFSEYANSRPQYTQEQIQSTDFRDLPNYYRQEGDPPGTLRVNTKKIQETTETALGLSLLLAEGGSGGSKRGSSLATLEKNKITGSAFENSTFEKLNKTNENFIRELTVKTKSGTKVRLDIIGYNSEGVTCIIECKSSKTAPLTKNQSKAFPEIKNSGAIVVGKGKPGLPPGTRIPKVEVNVIRPK